MGAQSWETSGRGKMLQSLLCLVVTCSYTPHHTEVLHDTLFSVTTVPHPPFIIEEKGEISGFLKEILDHVRNILQIRYNLKVQEDYRYQSMVEAVAAGSVDLAVADLTITPKRLLMADFTQPILTGGLVAITNARAQEHSVEELIENGYTFLVVQGGSTHRMVTNSDNPTLARINALRKDVRSIPEGKELLKNATTKYALLAERVGAHQYSADCQFKAIGEPLNLISHGFALGKGKAVRVEGQVFEVRTLLDYAIQKLKSDGTVSRLKDKYWPPTRC